MALIPLGAAWVWLLLLDHLKGNEIGMSLEATSTLLDYGRLSEPMEWQQRWFATQRHKITLYCLRWDSQEFLPLSEINVLELNRES